MPATVSAIGADFTPGYTSSPLLLAGADRPPTSTLDTGNLSDSDFEDATRATPLDVINSLGNIVLGGIAISRMPAQSTTRVPTTVAGRTTGTQVVPASSSIMSILLIGLVIVGVILLAKKL